MSKSVLCYRTQNTPTETPKKRPRTHENKKRHGNQQKERKRRTGRKIKTTAAIFPIRLETTVNLL